MNILISAVVYLLAIYVILTVAKYLMKVKTTL